MSKIRVHELAKELNKFQSDYSNYETGKNRIPVNFLVVLADYYGTTTDYILGRVKEK